MFFPKSSFADVGDVQAGLMHSIPSTGSTPAERFLALSIAGAQKTLYISNSYFVPGENFLRLLLAAARRGVDVRVLTVSRRPMSRLPGMRAGPITKNFSKVASRSTSTSRR